MKWGIAAAVASAAAVAAASGAELLACDCADQPPQQQEAAAAAVGRCDAFLVRHNQVCPRSPSSFPSLLPRSPLIPFSPFGSSGFVVVKGRGTRGGGGGGGAACGGEEVRAAVRRPPIHRDARHGAPLNWG